MSALETLSNECFRYVDDISYQIVAETGNPKDRHHLGKIMLKCFRDDPSFLMQIDGATDESDTFGSMLERSVRCAEAFKSLGIKRGDVIVLMASNCIDLTVPLYACFYLGVSAACIDSNLVKGEILHMLTDTRPKFVFCLDKKAQDVQEVLDTLGLDAQIATFGKRAPFNTLPEFLDKYAKNVSVDKFQAEDFDPSETAAILVTTSGSTGVPKVAALTHTNCMFGLPVIWSIMTKFPGPIRLGLIISPVQWLSAQMHFILSPILKYTRLQSSQPITPDHTSDLINKYKPSYIVSSPIFMTLLLTPGVKSKCDFSCLETVLLGGSVVSQEVVREIQSVNSKVKVYKGYGLTESTGLCLSIVPGDSPCSGQPMMSYQYRLVDIENGGDIKGVNTNGELWIKGPSLFHGYWNRPEETAKSLTEDGWFKTGDIFYRDEHNNFYFVDRLKLLLKYRNHQISPTEIEGVIRKHPAVLDVAVGGAPHRDGDLPVACVVARDAVHVTAQDIHDLVNASLTDSKQLRGGVIFMKQLPLTPTGKIDRTKLKSIICNQN